MTDPAVSTIGWHGMNTAARQRVIDRLRPAVRDVATGLGAHNQGERQELLEALGITCLIEAGWGLLTPPPDDARRRHYL